MFGNRTLKLTALLAFPAVSLFADANYDFELGIGTGYRQDSFGWHAARFIEENQLLYKEKNKNVRSIPLEVFGKAHLQNIVVGVRGDYAWIFDGKMNNVPVVTNPGQDPDISTFFHYKDGGFAWDVNGFLGLAFPVHWENTKLFDLIPEVGFSYHRLQISRHDQHPKEYMAFFGPMALTVDFNTSHHYFKQSWYGPYVGLELETDRSLFISVDLAYYYHFAALNQKSLYDLHISGTAPGGIPVFDDQVGIGVNSIQRRAHGHEALGKLTFAISSRWKLSFLADYLYFTTHKHAKTVITQDIDETAPAQVHLFQANIIETRSWWHSISGLAEIKYCF